MYTNFVKDAITLAHQKGELKGIKEPWDKVDPIIKSHRDMATSLQKHNEEENRSLLDLSIEYKDAMHKRETAALIFIEGKSAEELKAYLAAQPVAYNLWKDATHDVLLKLVFDVYDEVN